MTGPQFDPAQLSRVEHFGPVIIGAREIYDAVVRVSAKVDLLTAQMSSYDADAVDRENRIRALERARWPLPSVALLLSVGSLVVTLIIH